MDILINNVGIGNYKNLVDTRSVEYDETIDSNMRTTFLFTRHAVPVMMKQHSGIVLMISFMAGKYGFAGQAVYCATKFAQVGFAQSFDKERRPHGINADDTTVKIRDAQRKLKCTGYFHTYVGDGHHPLIVFDYHSGHGRDGPKNFLRNFRGYLQADAAPIYDGLFHHPRQLILEVGCWMHGRRNFFEDRATDRPRAELVLARIGQLYAVERELQARCADEWRDLPREQREDRIVDVRQQRSVPVLTTLHAWLEAETPKLLPKAALRGAMDYLLNHWQALVRYTTDGALAIDNGAAERALRGLTIGRKNWLFCGSERGAQAAAVHFSLIASCHRHGQDAYAYLRDVLTRLTNDCLIHFKFVTCDIGATSPAFARVRSPWRRRWSTPTSTRRTNWQISIVAAGKPNCI